MSDLAKIDFSSPAFDNEGRLRSLGAIAIQGAIDGGSISDVLDTLAEMSEDQVRSSLLDNGFAVPGGELDKDAYLIIGHALDRACRHASGIALPQEIGSVHIAGVGRDYTSRGLHNADAVLRAVLSAGEVAIEMVGDAPAVARGSLLMIAGQALEVDRQGFGFDGILGKYNIDLSLGEMRHLYRAAAGAVADLSARAALQEWSDGVKVSALHEWVPDSVQRLLHGSVSISAASAIVHAIDGGLVSKHAGEIGDHTFARLVRSQGIDVDAKTVAQQATDLGLSIVEPERTRAQYVGKVTGIDHRAALIKFSRDSCIELPFATLPKEMALPMMGDTVRVGFKAGAISVSVAERQVRESADR